MNPNYRGIFFIDSTDPEERRQSKTFHSVSIIKALHRLLGREKYLPLVITDFDPPTANERKVSGWNRYGDFEMVQRPWEHTSFSLCSGLANLKEIPLAKCIYFRNYYILGDARLRTLFSEVAPQFLEAGAQVWG